MVKSKNIIGSKYQIQVFFSLQTILQMSGCQNCQQLHAIQNRAEWRVKKYKKPDWKKKTFQNRIVYFFA